MTFIGHGRLRHCWFGEYAAVIGVKFATPALALVAQRSGLGAFEPFSEDTSVLRFEGKGAALKTAEAQLRAAGADMKKASSLKYSIDYGEPFEVTIRTEAVDDDSVQLSLLEA